MTALGQDGFRAEKLGFLSPDEILSNKMLEAGSIHVHA